MKWRVMALWCGLLCPCCGGGSTGPSVTPPMVAGDYAGPVLFVSAAPSDHCFAAGLARLGGHGFRYRIVVSQSGSQLSGSVDNDDMGIRCSFAGTVAGNQDINWTQTTCTDAQAAFAWSSEAQRECDLQVVQTGHTFEGRGRLNGLLSLAWQTRNATTGADLGAIQVHVVVNLG